MSDRLITLEDKYTQTSGRVFMTGMQALVRLPLAQLRRDRAAGLNTGAFISGYRGSPIGTYDQQLMLAKKYLDEAGVFFQPGVNEELAAAAVWGSQQLHLSPLARKDGVFGIWYGKGPGVDRSGDVFKHANAAGTSKHGGVLALAGDDHSCKSSTIPHQSDHAFMSALMPVLYPSSILEFLEMGLLGIAMSRYSGCWVGMKVIADTIETSAVVDLAGEQRQFVLPTDFEMPPGGLHLRWPDPPLVQDERLQEHKGYAAVAFARANKVDQVMIDTPDARFGIVASGKAYEDVHQALIELGIGEAEAHAIGLRVYKVRMPWPLEPEGIRHFSEGLQEILVVEERREIIENQIKQQLFNWRADVRPRIIGKFDFSGKPYLPLSQALNVGMVARAIGQRIVELDMDESLRARIRSELSYLDERNRARAAHEAPIDRIPYFCSGCPHNTSTRVPEGSRALAGIGCHYMAIWMDRNTATFTNMGLEGAPWTAIARFTDEKHIFVNLGDGTYFHSGLLAIRQAVASKVNVTYKILYNDAVAMTGGQHVDGDLSPQRVTHQIHHEGVGEIYLLSDTPDAYPADELAPGTVVRHRDDIDEVMKILREKEGCTAIVYVQTCAAEKRRRRKRGLMDDPDLRVVINPAVCEGCGDCSVQSNCVSIEPLETEFGRKRRINQSSCNKDYSCLKGFCPSFVSVKGGALKKREGVAAQSFDALPEPTIAIDLKQPWNIAITGVGGTGVLTIGALLGMAAHEEGKASMVLDMAGLAQKGGAVFSHVRIGLQPEDVASPRIITGGADVLLAADDVVAASKEGIALCDAARTHPVVNTHNNPVAGFVRQRDIDFRSARVLAAIRDAVKPGEHYRDFSKIAEAVLGDAIAANVMMLGYAWQCGFIPLERASLEAAIKLNGVSVKANLAAFNWGRALAADPDRVEALVVDKAPHIVESDMSLDDLIQHRAAHLANYQSRLLSRRYQKKVAQLQARAEKTGWGHDVVRAFARTYAKLLAYKDEYEVARLHAAPSFATQLAGQFDGDYALSYHLAPPFMSGFDAQGRPRKREFGGWMLGAFRVLAMFKFLRGTPFDPFGYSHERQAERALIASFESTFEQILLHQNGSNVAAALALCKLYDEIRGFGPVKADAIQRMEVARNALVQSIDARSSEQKPISMAAE